MRRRKFKILHGLKWSGTVTVLWQDADGSFVVDFDAFEGGYWIGDRATLTSERLAKWIGDDVIADLRRGIEGE